MLESFNASLTPLQTCQPCNKWPFWNSLLHLLLPCAAFWSRQFHYMKLTTTIFVAKKQGGTWSRTIKCVILKIFDPINLIKFFPSRPCIIGVMGNSPGPVVRTLQVQRAQVQSLIREVRSCKPQAMSPTKKKKKKKNRRICLHAIKAQLLQNSFIFIIIAEYNFSFHHC